MEGGTTQWGGYKTSKVRLKISFIYFLLPSKLLENVLRYRIFLCWHHTAWGLMFSKILYQGAEESRIRIQKDSGQGSAERVKGRSRGLTLRGVGLGSHHHSVSAEIFLDYLKIDTNCFTDCASTLEEVLWLLSLLPSWRYIYSQLICVECYFGNFKKAA